MSRHCYFKHCSIILLGKIFWLWTSQMLQCHSSLLGDASNGFRSKLVASNTSETSADCEDCVSTQSTKKHTWGAKLGCITSGNFWPRQHMERLYAGWTSALGAACCFPTTSVLQGYGAPPERRNAESPSPHISRAVPWEIHWALACTAWGTCTYISDCPALPSTKLRHAKVGMLYLPTCQAALAQWWCLPC